MVYRAIGIMSGSSLDGLDIVFASFEESRNAWSYEIKTAYTYEYNEDWQRRLRQSASLPAYDYLQLNAEYGKWIGEQINAFIETNALHHQVQLIASHGHTVFHAPENGFTAQLGSGAHIAGVTGINTVSDLRTIDVALGGQGAPVVPMGEKLLFTNHELLLNIGGIANITYQSGDTSIAFDICPANRILNTLAEKVGKSFDENGSLAAKGTVHDGLLEHLDAIGYYSQTFPKSLDNSFGLQTILPVIESYGQPDTADALATYVDHIVTQTLKAIQELETAFTITNKNLLVTGGGAFNTFLIKKLEEALQPFGYTIVIPDRNVVQYKEALIMALLGLLRWREENTVLQSVTGAVRSSIGGAVWMGQEA